MDSIDTKVRYGDIQVLYSPSLDGAGMMFRQDFVPVLRRIFRGVERVCEFASGGMKSRNRVLSKFLRLIESMLFRHSRVLYLVWRSAILPAQVAAESHEPVVSRFTSGLHGGLFIDIGANVGYYARLLEHNFRRIIAVEADPLIFGYLKRNCHGNCKMINAAVADSNGITLLREHPRNPGGSSVAYGVVWKAMKVRKISMSTLLENEPEADLVKVDVEGAELMVLKGAAPVMGKIRSWIIERHDPIQANELVTHMKRYGYTCTWLDENHAYFLRQ